MTDAPSSKPSAAERAASAPRRSKQATPGASGSMTRPGSGVTRRQALAFGGGGAALAAGLAPGLGLGLGGGALFAPAARADGGWSGGGIRSHGETLLGDLKYPADFARFDYVDPGAPKGGTARLSRLGRFDNFNAFIPKGQAAAEVGFVYETLMTSSADEASTMYGLLAEWIEQPDDYSWVAFKLRDGARWHDGAPVTVDDVIMSVNFFTTQAAPRFQFYYANVQDAVDEGDNIVRIRFDVTGNRELPHIMGQLFILPSHWWAERDMMVATLEAPLGSGPYRIANFEAGRFVELLRVEDYWGDAIAPNVGSNNFDMLRFEYFQDQDIAFEAFKADRLDFWRENSASRWAQNYDFPAARQGRVKRIEPVLDGPKSVQFFVMNTRREKFADRRVREAFSLAFDFEFLNRAVFFNQYAQPSSYFQGTPALMAAGVPEGAELALLEPFRDDLPAELFEKPFEAPKTDGSGNARRLLRRASRLLREAGCEVIDKVLHTPQGQPFEVEFLTASDSQRPVLEPFLQNLQILGAQTSLRSVDPTQYITRERSFDFDMVIDGLANSESPGNEQRDYWGSVVVDRQGGRNLAGVSHPAVDALIEQIIFAENREALEIASRALDRVLLWEHFNILELYVPFERIAYWDRVQGPEPLPPRAIGFPTVWWSLDA